MFAHIGVVALLVLLARLTVPESESWLAARAEGRAGVATTRAQRTRLSDLVRAPYTRPFLALILFYALANLAANTTGQYGTYVAVNLAGIPVETNSRIGLMLAPLAFLAAFWFMRIVDTRWRMLHFVIGGALLVAAYATPAVFGFSLATIVAVSVLSGVGNAFAFEGIMKVWTQESFPTMLRSTAQGAIVAVARVSAAVLATLTPAVFDASPRGMYGGLAVVVLIALVIAWSAFHGTRGRNEFLVEEQEAEPAEASAPAVTA
jgi:inositol transporter-like SP family MFS transporter